MDLIQEIKNLQNIVSNQKSERDKLIGQKDGVLEQLSEEYSVTDEKSGRTLLEKIIQKKELLTKKLTSKLTELKKDYDW